MTTEPDNNNPNELATSLVNNINKALSESTRVAIIPKKQRTIKPWITPGILRCIKNRNYLHAKLRKDANNDVLKMTFRRYRNYCCNLIKKTKT